MRKKRETDEPGIDLRLIEDRKISINDSVYSSVFFFLTGLHFFHLVVGLLLLSLLSWSSSFSFRKKEDQRSGDQLLDRAGKLDSLEDCSSLQLVNGKGNEPRQEYFTFIQTREKTEDYQPWKRELMKRWLTVGVCLSFAYSCFLLAVMEC